MRIYPTNIDNSWDVRAKKWDFNNRKAHPPETPGEFSMVTMRCCRSNCLFMPKFILIIYTVIRWWIIILYSSDYTYDSFHYEWLQCHMIIPFISYRDYSHMMIIPIWLFYIFPFQIIMIVVYVHWKHAGNGETPQRQGPPSTPILGA